MEKFMSVICAMGTAIVCLVMIYFEIINGHVPTLVWFAFSMFMFANAALARMKAKQAFANEAK